jgi:protein-tyrosine phosphatase
MGPSGAAFDWQAGREAPAGRSDRFFVDIHCHCLPGLDDGPENQDEALALCRALADDHIGTVVATPHQLGRYDGSNEGPAVRQAVADLNQLLNEERIPLTVLPGGDVRIDERMADLVQSGRVLTVADGGRYVMLELPHEVFIDPGLLLAELAGTDLHVFVSHPERHRFLARTPHHVRQWLPYGVALQITAASFLGEFGRLSEQAAWQFLDEPLPLLVATDAHDTVQRPPRMTEAYNLLCRHLGREAADVLCFENPQRLLAGEALLQLDGGIA